jgi:hypothetical protein
MQVDSPFASGSSRPMAKTERQCLGKALDPWVYSGERLEAKEAKLSFVTNLVLN